MCEIAKGDKTDETIVYEDEFIQVVKDKAGKSNVHLLIYPKKHIDSWKNFMGEGSTINAMLKFAYDYILSQSDIGQNQICLYMANCPRHPHLHMQII